MRLEEAADGGMVFPRLTTVYFQNMPWEYSPDKPVGTFLSLNKYLFEELLGLLHLGIRTDLLPYVFY